MKLKMSERDVAICVAALENCAKNLREGVLASQRLGLVRQDFMLEKSASEMDDLKSRLLKQFDINGESK